jgi:glycerate 2-kinase
MSSTVVCAPDKFRGSLTAAQAAAALAGGARAAGFETVEHPLADGGEGTMRLVAAARGGRFETVTVHDPLGRPHAASFAVLDDETVIVEAAEAIGLTLLAAEERDPILASSAGFGELIRAALAAGPQRLICCLGGSGTVDGGLGMLRALGVELRDADNQPVSGSGGDLQRVCRVDTTSADRRLRGVELLVALDVASPLFGFDGAAYVFGPQKGATPDQVRVLDAGLRRLAPLYGDAAMIPGAGAAGGLGAALALLGARARPGAGLVMDETGFADRLATATLCLTGEGRADHQTAHGKTAARVAEACQAARVACFIIAGSVEEGAEPALRACGATLVMQAARGPGDVESILANAARDVALASEAVCRAFAAGAGARESPRRPG